MGKDGMDGRAVSEFGHRGEGRVGCDSVVRMMQYDRQADRQVGR